MAARNTGTTTPQMQCRQVDPEEVESHPFNFAPAVLLPFKGFPPSPPAPLEHHEKLQKIIENLEVQQELVRGNMLYLAQRQALNLVARAKKELDAMTDNYEDDPRDLEEMKLRRQEVDAMIGRIKVLAKGDANIEDLELKPGIFLSNATASTVVNPGANGVIEMGGTDMLPQSRTARMVLNTLSHDMNELVNLGVSQMEAYDTHSQKTIKYYKKVIERRTARNRPSSPATPSFRGGLRKSTAESTGDLLGMRRMSTGMRISGIVATPPTRTLETMEDLVRRGSK